jgi:hypothetical protein
MEQEAPEESLQSTKNSGKGVMRILVMPGPPEAFSDRRASR